MRPIAKPHGNDEEAAAGAPVNGRNVAAVSLGAAEGEPVDSTDSADGVVDVVDFGVEVDVLGVAVVDGTGAGVAVRTACVVEAGLGVAFAECFGAGLLTVSPQPVRGYPSIAQMSPPLSRSLCC